MKRFVIFSEPRSGTTFFNASINFHPDILSLGEILPGHVREEGFHYFWLQKIQEDPGAISLEHVAKVFQSYIRNVFSSRKERALGFDIKYYHLEWKSDFLNILKAENFHVIHVIRRNILKRHVSWILHQPENRNLLNRPMHTTQSVNPVLLVMPDVAGLAATFEQLENRLAYYSRLFSSNFPCLTVNYEEMVDAGTNFLAPETQEAVFRFLGVAPLQETPSTPLRKMNPNKLRHSILNYHEVVAALAGTRYRDFLDDSAWDVAHLAFHQEMALGHQMAGSDLGAALGHYLKASHMVPDDAEPYYQMALVHAATKRHAKTAALFEKALALATDPQMRGLYQHSWDLLQGKTS